MTNRRIWATKTEDESGPLWTLGVDGEGDGQGVDEKTPPRAQDLLKSPPSQPASDPVFEAAALKQPSRPEARWQIGTGMGGVSPYLPDGPTDVDAEWENFDLENQQKLEALGIDPQGEFSNEDLDRAGVPRLDDSVISQVAASLQQAGITGNRLNPDFLQQEFGLSREQAFALMNGLLEQAPPAEDWLTPEEIEASYR